MARKTEARSRWLQGIKARRGTNRACVAYANKMARIVWVLLAKGERYRRASCMVANGMTAAAYERAVMSTDDGPVPNLSDTCRTLFGTITLTSPRLWHCRYSSHQAASFSPLVELVSERTAPELLFMETNWASLVSYGMTVEALKDFLPVDETLSVSTVRTNALAVAQRWETELGGEQWSFIEGCP
jgi:hypothetical protein